MSHCAPEATLKPKSYRPMQKKTTSFGANKTKNNRIVIGFFLLFCYYYFVIINLISLINLKHGDNTM